MAGRRIRDEKDARACLAAAEASGLERAVWARQEGIDGRSLNMWRMNLRREDKSGRGAMQLLELVPSAPPPKAARYVVRCGALAIELDDDFNQDTLYRLLQVVTAC